MSHDDSQDNKSSFTVSRRQVLGALGGASVLTLLGVNPLRAGQGGRNEKRTRGMRG